MIKNKKYQCISSNNFKKDVKRDDKKLKRIIKTFLDTSEGRSFLVEQVKNNKELQALLRGYCRERSVSGIGATEIQGFTTGYGGATGAIGIMGVTGFQGEQGFYGITGSTGVGPNNEIN